MLSINCSLPHREGRGGSLTMVGLLLSLLLLLTSCSRWQGNASANEGMTQGQIVSSDHTSLYDQGKTSACWIYAMLTCIEREQLNHGDSITLSRHWLMARLMEEQTMDCHLTDGAREISMRGVGPEALRLISKYGLVPYIHEKTHITNSNVLERKLRIIAGNATSISNLRERTAKLLPEFTVARPMDTDAPPSFYLYGMRYNTLQFAESIMYNQQWLFFASVDYHPWGERFALEVPDNRRYHEYTNIPMKQLLQMVRQSLANGHPVYWEYGKHHTSSHAMAILGIKRGKDGKDYFLCQNSYGKQWGNKGCCLISTKFFLDNTCNVGILKDNFRS